MADPAPAVLLPRIPMGVARIALLGGDAALAAALRRRDPAAAITCADAPDSLPDAAFDVVVWPAGLAEAADTAAALRQAGRALAPGGVLVAGVPNPDAWGFAAALLAGGWSPDADGPLGGRHLRLLTPEVLRQAFADSGLVGIDSAADGLDAAGAAHFAQAMAPALRALGTSTEAYARRAAPARLVLRAAAAPPEQLVVVAHALKPVGGVNDVRIDLPLGAMATHPCITVQIAQNPATPDLPPGTPRILLLHRRLLNAPEAPAFIDRFRRAGWVVVQEFDDDPAHWPVIAQSAHFAFRGVHAVQTTTPRLAALFGAFNGEVAIFPNTVADLPEPANFADPHRMTLFLGALRREQDIAPFLPALNAVLAEANGRLAVEVLFDRGTFDALQTPHKRFHGLLPYAQYRAVMAGCEIGFLPLADTVFNSFKSDLKFVECGAHGLATLASPVVYADTIRDGETGHIVHTPAQCESVLRRLLAQPAEARALGRAARDWVRGNRMLAGQVAARLAWYRGLWARRVELDAALLRRAPECRGPGLY